jgi:tRNA G10  N-methylase Trm11
LARQKAGVLECHAPAKSMPLWVELAKMCGPKIVDPFLGNGTTLIAAEKTGRVCYGMEIDPKYCDVIIKRYADYVGIDEKVIRKTVKHG